MAVPNWSPQQVPSASDDVIIPSLAGSQTITVGSGTRAARTIQVGGDEKVRITGGELTVSAAATILSGTGSVEVAGGAMTLAGSNWVNSASALVLASGTLNLGGSFVQSSIGTFQRTNNGGTLNLTGNVTGNLNLDASLGPWNFGGSGRLTNSRLMVDPSVTFTSAGAFTFDNVTIASNSVVTVTKDPLYIINGLTIELDAQLRLGDTSSWGFLVSSQNQPGANTQLIDGNGSIVFNNQGNNTLRSEFNSPATNGELVLHPSLILGFT